MQFPSGGTFNMENDEFFEEEQMNIVTRLTFHPGYNRLVWLSLSRCPLPTLSFLYSPTRRKEFKIAASIRPRYLNAI
jgi:hypothetical protein